MMFNWSEYLSLAEAQCGMPVSGPPAGVEANQRAAVSRAYYAAYISARNRLRDVDKVRIAANNEHRFVRTQYESHADPLRARIGIGLNRLRVDRNKCDYHDVVKAVPTVAERSLARASQILTDLAHL